MPKNDEKLLAAAIYVLNFFVPILGPLLIWLFKKDESSFIDYHGREYFNFMISYTVYMFVSGLLTIIVIGFLALWIVGTLAFIFNIVAAIKAFEGQHYRMPLVFRLL
ncbi:MULTISPECIES: DUF4870 domain-containing protein [unclassified Bacillus (in: firmicutes)]|uniref:DUF4870 domain-containing protein n=1 Tax=unclassified Bacillus (in: firmicutes) TaxID=185979 RepID=UPI0008E9FB7B|nr:MULTISPECIES: DUF4870 domain-containing protein [unclassified Bacillus (in: firmicutes)]SFA91833.1 hypothetical protein SAMN02799634_102607 [Bacillus sp. UNCCL13]SFQ85686.1 hypothetical protein SAMN04488577_2725 [Bacillus sp. cl95]